MFNKNQIVIPATEHLLYLSSLEEDLKVFVNNIRILCDNKTSMLQIWDYVFQISVSSINEPDTYNALIDNLQQYTDEVDVQTRLKDMYLLIRTKYPELFLSGIKNRFKNSLIYEYKLNEKKYNTFITQFPFAYLLPLLSNFWFNT